MYARTPPPAAAASMHGRIGCKDATRARRVVVRDVQCAAYLLHGGVGGSAIAHARAMRVLPSRSTPARSVRDLAEQPLR